MRVKHLLIVAIVTGALSFLISEGRQGQSYTMPFTTLSAQFQNPFQKHSNAVKGNEDTIQDVLTRYAASMPQETAFMIEPAAGSDDGLILE